MQPPLLSYLSNTQKHPSSHGIPQKKGCRTEYPVVVPITAYSYRQSRHSLSFSTPPQALLSTKTRLAVLSEVLNGTDHLRGVGVLVVVPRHDLNLIGVVVATLNFHDFFVIVHNFETTVTVPQHTVVVPKPACSYQNYTTFRRYFQGFSQFCVFGCFCIVVRFMRIHFSCDIACIPRSVRDPGLPPGAFALPRCAPQGGWMIRRLDNGSIGVLTDWLWRWVVLIFEEYF